MSPSPPANADAPDAVALPPDERVARFIGRLQHVAQPLPGGPGLPHAARTALHLAEAALRYREAGSGGRPAQVAVLGPTQTGKSTTVNLLAGRPVTEVSPLAGFTVHPHGVWITADSTDDGWVAGLLPGWSRVAPAELDRNHLDRFSLGTVPPTAGLSLFEGGAAALPACVLWDTPDFDSLAARQYEPGVLEIAALADVYLLVLSKEKYSDLSVWRLLELLAPLRRPLILCVNKLSGDGTEVVLRSLRERLAERGAAWGEVAIVTLPHVSGSKDAPLALPPQTLEPLRAAVRAGLAGADAAARSRRVRAFVRLHWDTWLEPVRVEHAALAEWDALLHAAGMEFVQAYEHDYLNHPQRFDSFRRAAVELLNLLELPGVGGIMSRARQVVTWPARALLAAGRSWWTDRRPPLDRVHSLGAEAGVLIDSVDTLLTHLQREVARRSAPARPGAAVWQALEQRLDTEGARLRGVFERAITTHHEAVTREIRSTARALYEELQQHPNRLNALRTTRATIDVGYLLLAVKTGGLTPLDALWAPATFALTSLLMEGVAGLEMRRAASQLRQRQREKVQGELVDGCLRQELRRLGLDLKGPGVLGVRPDEVEAAQAALAAWERADG